MRTAKQLVDTLAACTICGKEHQPWKTITGHQTWAAKDGHPYRTYLFEMTGRSSDGFIEKLRELASS